MFTNAKSFVLIMPAPLFALMVSVCSECAWAPTPSFPSESELQGRALGEWVSSPGRYGETDADWGYLFVPEDRTANSRTIRLIVVRQRSINAPDFPPIFNLVGGPGNSNVWGSGELPASFHERNDVVRVGYRGIDSNVPLKCPEFTSALQTDRPLSVDNIETARKQLRTCNDRLRAEGIRLDGYNLAEVINDLEAARVALGYDRINLLAVSWGTQIALSYATRHPEHVHRMLLIGAGGRARGFDLWDPKIIDQKLRAYSALWSADPRSAARTPDLVSTIRKVFAALPQDWRGIHIDPDKVRLVMWHMLGDTASAAQFFDAVVDAEHGDPAGLALLSWSYDHELKKEQDRRFGPYHGEFFAKVMSSGLDPVREWIHEMDPEWSIMGSPAAKLLWGAASHGGFPMREIPPEYRRNSDIDAESAVLAGDLDVAAPVEYVKSELMPHLKRGQLVVLSNRAHGDLIRLEPEAFHGFARRFFYEGIVDSSGFANHSVRFQPEQSLSRQARELFPQGNR